MSSPFFYYIMVKLAEKGRDIMKKRYGYTALVIFYVGFIFLNSLTPAAESSKQSGWVLQTVKQIAALLEIDGPWLTEHLVRKTAHFAEYSVLGVLLWNCIKSYGWKNERLCLLQCWLGTVIPLTDETLQLVTSGRSGQVTDVWLDISGLLFGTLAAIGAAMLWSRQRDRKEQGGNHGKR